MTFLAGFMVGGFVASVLLIVGFILLVRAGPPGQP